jgi:MFS family permease
MTPSRPPYRAALLTTALVLGGYLLSLAPSVTFWDAGEFIASMKILGIPHPPGTPLFILLGHVWAKLIPFGEYAWRTNLMSAVFSAAAAGLWFLITSDILARLIPGDGLGERLVRLLGAGAAAVILAFSFTNWQNSNETEVYAVASFIVASVGWLSLRWRVARGTDRAPKYLLLIVYLLGLSIANHLLALLAGPAMLAFLFTVARGSPLDDPIERRREWAKLIVLAGLWALLLGIGLGSTTLSVLGAILFVLCALFAMSAGAMSFALIAVAIALVGVTPYLFLYLRSPQNPFINESAPGTWDALLAVIRRDQYPPRTPLDDPRMLPGPDNPGRSLTIVGLQLLNYMQYFAWQWGKSWMTRLTENGGGAVVGLIRVLPTALFLALGSWGLTLHWRADKQSWWFLVVLWLATGLGLMAYMNFKPGASIGYEQFPQSADHEVRERDYFFVISFIVWAVWAGIALANLARQVAGRLAERAQPAAFAVFALALLPPIGNFAEADRGNGPDARLAGDWAYSLLNSVPPNGLLFTFGDNDTFPLWWAQEVEGIRQDVRVVCLALARTDWYNRQLRDNPERPFDSTAAPVYWRQQPTIKVDWPLHSMTNAELGDAVPQLLPKAVPLRFGPYQSQLDSNSVIYTEDIISIRVIQQNFGRRPIVWGLASGGKYFGLDPLVVQRGIGMQLTTTLPDTADHNLVPGLFQAPVDLEATRRLATEVYRYADLLQRPVGKLETTAAGMANTMSLPFVQLGASAQSKGDLTAARGYYEQAYKVYRNPGVRDALRQVSQSKGGPPEGDSALPKPR